MPLEDVRAPDGRTLEVLTAGDEEGVAFVFHSGSPSAAVPYEPFHEAAAHAGLRLITYSRPGYGGSSPRTGTFRVADDVTDVVTILDHLGVAEFVTLGWSGGGPRALACAGLLPGRCLAATSLAGIAPGDADGLDWFAGMASENVDEYEAARAGLDVYTAYLEREALPMLAATGPQVADAMGGLLTQADRGALTTQYADWIAELFHRAATQGVVGMRDDGLVLFEPWGFDLDAITTPVAIWQGDQDAMVPYAHGEWLAAHVAGARAHLEPGEGHLTLAARIDDLLAELKQLARLA